MILGKNHIPEIVGGGGTKTYFKNDLQKGGCYRLEVTSSLKIERKEVSASSIHHDRL